MKSTKGPIYFSMILVTVLMLALMYAIYEQNHVVPINPTDNDENSSSSESLITYEWNGEYNKADNTKTIYIYQTQSDQIAVVTKDSGVLIYFANKTGINEYQCTYNDILYVLNNNNNNIEITSDQISDLSGNYVLVNSYDEDKYIKDTIGNSSYVNSIWNGIYTYSDLTLKIYELDKEKFIINVSNTDQSINYEQMLTLSNSALNYTSDDGQTTLKIYFESSKLTIEGFSSDPLNHVNNINGSYSKISKYSYEQIIANLR